MATQWFYQSGGDWQAGPVDSRELRRLAEVGIVKPDTLVRQGDSARWVRAEQVRGLFQRSTAPPSSSPVPESLAPIRGVSGESPIRHGLGAAAVNEAPEKPERVWPVTWAAIIVGSGSALLLLWALVFRGGSEPQQQAEKDQPLLAAAESAESGAHAPEQHVHPKPPPQVARMPASATKTPTYTDPPVVDEDKAPAGPDWWKNIPVVDEPEQPEYRDYNVEGKVFRFPTRLYPTEESVVHELNKIYRDKIQPEEFSGRALPWDSDETIKNRQRTPLGQSGIAEHADEMGVKPEEVSAEVLAEYIRLRKAEAERAAKAPDTNPVALRQYKEHTAAMERDLDRPWSNRATGERYAGKSDKLLPVKAAPAAEPMSAPPTGNVKTLELADLAELVGPSVVQVNVTGPEEAGTGSGFVLDKQGTIVTNFHVIEDATAGRIVFSDKTSAPITGYLGVWPEKDIALVRVECPPEKLRPLRLATSAPRQGEQVAAFGSPLGLQQSVSEGIVSAVRESKELRALGPTDVNARLIQTTTPISKGNSGGPLVDMKGRVVGVNTLTFRSLGGENVNFAVAAVELPPLLLAKNDTPSPLPASDPTAGGVRRIMSRASDHLMADEYDRAIADYTEAIRLDPKNALAYFFRGFAYRHKHEYDSAIADFTEAIRLDPKDADAYVWRGFAYLRKYEYDRAIADFTEAIRLKPEYALAYSGRGDAYRLKHEYDSAIADFTEAIRL
ncbi:MAG: trypsin-like peptidase domain-containing protein, partial [Pirellulales bacterium]|nr:trypsin-like peptidase domain-containing protein [Pirellulales bacterium]